MTMVVRTAEGLQVAESAPIDFASVRSAFHDAPSALPTTTQLDATAVAVRAFAEAGRSLRPAGEPGVFLPGPVWISEGRQPIADQLRLFARHATAGRLAYLIHGEDLSPEADAFLDRMRLRGYPVIPVAFRALRAALTDGSSQAFLMELERRSGTMDNLFDTRNALTDERFLFGRSALLNTIGSAVARNEQVLITGLRKVGKTSMLNILRQHLVDHPVCMVDLQRFDRHHEDWPAALFHLMIEAVDRWGNINIAGWPFNPERPATATELERELERRQAYLERPMRLVVILDEIERVFPSPGEEAAAQRWIRASGALRLLAQGGRRFVSIIGADLRPRANRHNSLGPAGTNPLFSFFKEVPLNLLDHGALGKMVYTIAEEMGLMEVEPTFVERLHRLTGGHPSLARTVAGEAYRHREAPGRMSEGDLERGLTSLHDSDGVGYFLRNNLWQLMTSAERAVTAELAGVAGSPVTVTERRQAETTLTAQGLIEHSRISIDLLTAWIRENGPPPRAATQQFEDPGGGW